LNIIYDGSKFSKERNALLLAIESKNKLGKSAENIINRLRGQSFTEEKSEAPDFILKSSSGVTGIEHFQVSTGSVKKKDNWQSLPDEIKAVLNNCDDKQYINDKTKRKLRQAMEATRYPASIDTFRDIFNKHLEKAKIYKKNICKYGGDHLIFFIEMLFWDFIGLTAVGKKTFNCNYDNIPLSKEIVDIISVADDVDSVIIFFNYNPYHHNSTLFAFTPTEARNGEISEEIYEYVGYDESLEKKLIKLSCDEISTDKINTIDNYFELCNEVTEDCKKSQAYILSGKSCLVNTFTYDMMIYKGIIDDKRKNS